MPYKDKERQIEFERKYYLANKSKFRAAGKKTRAMARKRNRQYVDIYLSTHPCVDCGQSDVNVLEFDHTANNKSRRGVSGLIQDGGSIRLVQKEMDKCEVRCCNCHRRMTLSRLGKLRENKQLMNK